MDRYITCPFKYFAEHVLGLPEERDELAGLTPLERGTLMHSIFEQFYGEWQLSGHGAITSENLPEADALFSRHRRTLRSPAARRRIGCSRRLRLLGSVVAPALADRVFDAGGRRRPSGVRERLLEQELFGAFAFPV